MRIAHDMDLKQLIALIGPGAGFTIAHTLRHLLAETVWTDTDDMTPEAWALYVDMAETAIKLGVQPRLTFDELLLQAVND